MDSRWTKRKSGTFTRMDLASMLTDPSKAALPIAAGVLTQVLRASLSGLERHGWGKRLLPLLPVIIAVALAMAGVGAAGAWRERLLFGIFSGALAGHGYKLLKTTLAGRGLSDEPAADPPARSRSAPANPTRRSDPPSAER